jgi:hypothetical protein
MEAPLTHLPPRLISSASRYFSLWDAPGQAGLDTPFASAVFAGSLATAHPFRIPFSYPVRRLFWVNGGAVAGNVEIALYSAEGQQFWTSGLVAQAGVSTLQYVSDDFILPPGAYFLTCVGDNIAGAHWRRSNVAGFSGRAAGILQKSSASPLPASLSGFSVHATSAYWLCGLTLAASGY